MHSKYGSDRGYAKEEESTKPTLIAMEKKLNFPTNINAALRRFSIEHIVSDLLKKNYKNCTAKQIHNEVFLHGGDKDILDQAAIYISNNIGYEDLLVCGSLREKKDDVVHHLKNRYHDRVIVYIEKACHLHMLGLKDAVYEASSEYIELKEGRKSISQTFMSQTNKTRKDTKRFKPLKRNSFEYLTRSHQLDQVMNLEKVTIFRNESECSFTVQGGAENVSRAVEYLENISAVIQTKEIIIPCNVPISMIKISAEEGFAEKCLRNFNVLLEKKTTFVVGRLHVTNILHNFRSNWITSGGRKISVVFTAFGDLRVDKRFVMKRRDPNKGGNFNAKMDGIVEIAVPDMVNREENDANTIANIINTTLSKVADSSSKKVAYLISRFANWDFSSIMKCMVNSFIEWLIRSGTTEGFSVTLCVENQADFIETDDYFGSRLWTKMKDFGCRTDQPEIKIVRGYLDKTEADVIVNSVSPDLNLNNGKVSASLLKAAGQRLQEDCKIAFPNGISNNNIVVTKGYELKCKSVFHITLQRNISSARLLNSIRQAMLLCLRTAADYNYESMAFPAMGTGGLNYPLKEVASEMVMAMERFSIEYKKAISIREVQFVIHPKDSTLFETFEKMVEELVKPARETEVDTIFRITGLERDVDKCKSWLIPKLAIFSHGQIEHSTNVNRPDYAFANHIQDTSNYSTFQGKDSSDSTAIQLSGGAANPGTGLSPRIVFGTSKLTKQTTNACAETAVKTIKTTGRARPQSVNSKAITQPEDKTSNMFASSIIYECYKKELVCKLNTEADIKVKIHCGDIINLQDIHAVVCSENKAGDAKGFIARQLYQNGGEDYRKDKATKFKCMPRDGDIITTSGGKNNYLWIIHAIMPRKNLVAIQKMYMKIFEEIAKERFTSVSLPLLGTGVGDVDARTCSEILFDELLEFCRTGKWGKLSLHIVINDEQVVETVIDVFRAKINTMNASNKPEKPDEKEEESVKTKILYGSPADIDESLEKGEEAKDCVICMDKVEDEMKLPCGHIFCAECIEGYFKVRKVCPTCGKVCGIVTGDQPNGTMEIIKQAAPVTGFEGHKTIAINYSFESGIQGVEHPRPGEAYKGIRRTAYLPDNKRGREICCMLTVAFERRLVFTIGTSRTTGKECVITWNDIHHKTDIRPNTQFGYPDETYLQRIGEELVVKGVTLKDVDQRLLKKLENDDFTKVITMDTKN